jgi:RNA polymerase-binding transcription factor DksA
MAKSKKKAPAKKKSGKATKPAPKPAPARARPAAKSAPKAAPAKKAAPAPAPKRPPVTMEKPSKKSALRNSILARKAPAKPIAFSLDEVRAIAKTVTPKAADDKAAAKNKTTAIAKALAAPLKPAKPNHVKAASLADILGFSPGKPKKAAVDSPDVPEKFKRYYKLLVDLRTHLTAGIELHSEETLKRSAKDDAGDLSSYGQHMADAGTDTFDRDFALSLVSSEQEALAEIEAAIKRIHDGTYGICEITAKPIAKERLLAVPFTRYSAEAQKGIERNRHRTRTQAGLFGEIGGEDSGKIMDEDGGND